MLKIKSLKLNFIMNFIRVLLNSLFPLITFPYISRILLADGVGKVSFAQGVTNYFMLLSSLGIGVYGIRAVAKVRDDKDKLSQLVYEMLVILLIMSSIVLVGFLFFIFTNSKAESEIELFLLMGSTIIFTNIGVEWFYQGIEDYKYITTRSIIFKIISLILLFFTVKTEEHYLRYAAILIISITGSGILNFINLRKHISLKNIQIKFNIKKHIRPILIAFSFILATSIYVNLDTVMLGYMVGDRSVGLYTASIRVTKIVVTLVTAFGGVLIPRISYYYENDLKNELERVLNLSANINFLLGIPSMLGLFILAPDIIRVFAGNDFGDSVLTMRLLLPLIFFLGFSNLIGMQLLYPFGQERKVLISVLIGALVNLFLNVLLIPYYQHFGAAFSTMIAEGTVLLVQIILSKDLLKFIKVGANVFKILLSSLIMGGVVLIVQNLSLTSTINIIISMIVGVLVYILSLIVLKEDNITNFFREGFNYVKKI